MIHFYLINLRVSSAGCASIIQLIIIVTLWASIKSRCLAGRESVDRIFSPERLSRCSSIGSIGFAPSASPGGRSLRAASDSAMASLEAVLADSQAKCSALVAELTGPEFPPRQLAEIKQLNQNLETMQVLLMRLRAQL